MKSCSALLISINIVMLMLSIQTCLALGVCLAVIEEELEVSLL